MKSIIKVYNIYAEDLFLWFYKHVMGSCGDGCGAIVCENFKETADWFTQWLTHDKLFHDKFENENLINFHDQNENFIFTNSEVNLYEYDYIFEIMGDCIFSKDKSKVIKKWKKTNEEPYG